MRHIREKRSFFNPRGEIARKLGVVAAKFLKVETLFEAFAGGGARTLLYAKHLSLKLHRINEGNRVFVCELLYEYLNANLPDDRLKITVEDFLRCWKREVCTGRTYDWVDLDPFGSPSPFLIGAISIAKPGGHLYITSTDTATLSGRRRGDDIRLYGVFLRPWETYGELGARALIYSVWNAANHLNRHIAPVFVFYEGYAYRLLVRVEEKRNTNGIGYINRCKTCGTYSVSQRNPAKCGVCGGETEGVGPIWVGRLYERETLQGFKEVALKMGWKDVAKVLTKMLTEPDTPMYYPLSGFRLHRTPSLKVVIKKLEEMGYSAGKTQFSPQGVKTDAPVPVLKEVLHSLTSHP